MLFKTGLISGGPLETVTGLFGRLENKEGLLNSRWNNVSRG
jgi:hypothetical protein